MSVEFVSFVSTLDDDDLQILARNDQRRLSRNVEPFQQGDDLLLERYPLRRVQGCEGLDRRSIEIAEDLNPVCARAVAEIEELAHAADVGSLGAEQRHDMRLGSPQGGRLESRRRRDVGADGLEQLADESLRRP